MEYLDECCDAINSQQSLEYDVFYGSGEECNDLNDYESQDSGIQKNKFDQLESPLPSYSK